MRQVRNIRFHIYVQALGPMDAMPQLIADTGSGTCGTAFPKCDRALFVGNWSLQLKGSAQLDVAPADSGNDLKLSRRVARPVPPMRIRV